MEKLLRSALTLSLLLAACGPTALPGTPVTGLTDSGPGSLREALAGAKDGDMLRFTTTGTVTLASPLIVDKDVTVVLDGVVLDAGDTARALEVAADAAVTVQGGTLAGGSGSLIPLRLNHQERLTAQATSQATYGGVVLTAGALTLSGTVVTGGKANNGGGIAVMSGGTLTLTDDAKVTGNDASPPDPDLEDEVTGTGGGIFNMGSLLIDGGHVDANTARFTAGGIRNTASGTVTLKSGSINGNAATKPFTDTEAGSAGGGIFTTGNVDIQGGSISNNSASYFGGGLAVQQRAGVDTLPTVVISGGVLEGNQTTDATRSGGGGVFSAGLLTITGGTLKGNTSAHGGAVDNWGDLKIGGGTFEGNHAERYGGAVLNVRQARGFEMTGGTMTGNTAGLNGGAINLDGPGVMTGGTIENNTAQGNGGGIQLYSAAGQKTTFTVGGTAMIRANNARSGAGLSVGSAEAGGTTLTIEAGTISGNAASVGGGGVDVGRFAVLNLSGGSISANTAVGTGGGLAGGGTVNMTGGDIEGNAVTGTTPGSEGGGGGVRLYTGAVFTASGGTIRNNTSLFGGGVFIGAAFEGRPAGQFVLAGAVVSGNKIGNNVGGGFFNDGVLTIQSGSVTGNVAGRDAGGIFNTVRSAYTHTGGIISGNQPNDVVQGK